MCAPSVRKLGAVGLSPGIRRTPATPVEGAVPSTPRPGASPRGALLHPPRCSAGQRRIWPDHSCLLPVKKCSRAVRAQGMERQHVRSIHLHVLGLRSPFARLNPQRHSPALLLLPVPSLPSWALQGEKVSGAGRTKEPEGWARLQVETNPINFSPVKAIAALTGAD